MDWHSFLTLGHIIGTALGVGGATAGDFLFFKSIRDKKITSTEFSFLKAVSGIVWLGFLILVFSGFGFLLLFRLNLTAGAVIFSPSFLAKMTIVLVIFFNGLLMHLKVFPLFEKHINQPLNSPEFLKKSRLVFLTGVISITSWYSALILGVFRNLKFSYLTIVSVYLLVILAGAFLASIIFSRLLKDKK